MILCCIGKRKKPEILTSELTIEANHEAFQPQPIKTIECESEVITSQPIYNEYAFMEDFDDKTYKNVYVNCSISKLHESNLRKSINPIYAKVTPPNSIGSVSGHSKPKIEKLFTKKPQPTPRTTTLYKKQSDINNLNKINKNLIDSKIIESPFQQRLDIDNAVEIETIDEIDIANEIGNATITEPDLLSESVDGNRIQQKWKQNINDGVIYSEVTLYNYNQSDTGITDSKQKSSIRLKLMASGLDRDNVAKHLCNGDISVFGINLNQFDEYLKILDVFDIKETSGGTSYTYIGQNCVNGVCKLSEIPEETAFVTIDNNLKMTNVYMVDNRIVKIDESLWQPEPLKGTENANINRFESAIIKTSCAFYQDRKDYESLDKMELEECRPDDRYIISFDEQSVYENFYYFHAAKSRKKLRKNLTTRELFKIASLNRYILFETSCLNAHNKFRLLHGVPPLEANDNLNIAAREWAERLALTGLFHHRPNNEYGENLYYGENMNMSVHGYTSVKHWYDEIELYDYKNPRYIKGTTHFTQLIWRDTREMGTGVAIVGDKIWVCCNYYPAGNILEKFNSTYVPPPLSNSKSVTL